MEHLTSLGCEQTLIALFITVIKGLNVISALRNTAESIHLITMSESNMSALVIISALTNFATSIYQPRLRDQTE